MKRQGDYWHNDYYFVCDNQGYGLRESGETYATGAVIPQDNGQALPDGREVDAKIPDSGIIPSIDIQEQTKGIMQYRRGRPKKEGSVHRATTWRRQQKEKQEIQGVLV